jgi:trans-aconitate methyltransferase
MKGKYYHTKETVEEYIKLAEDVNGKQLIDKFEKLLAPQSTILEIGSGPGSDWKILNQSFNVVGSDNSIEFLDHLISKNPQGEFLKLNAITLQTSKRFDGIYSNKVLQHLNENELLASVKRQKEVLNENGVICHSFWKGEGSEMFKGMFVNYLNEAILEKVFKEYFEVISISSYQEFEEGDSLLLLARKKCEVA